ncbi:MAG TPA: glycosyltransferase family 87 protein, partial [Chthoniobacterales bacterium]|nr:glycosyltransferase family 87 protein [Chthoniobacterales bacterium]
RGSALLWLALFLYIPFLIAHGVDAWTQPAVDFPPLYSATKVVFDEHRAPYGDNAFEQQAIALGRWVPPFIYPPPSLLLIWPLHFFSYEGAKALMLVINHACLLFALGFMLRKLFRDDSERSYGTVAAALIIAYALLFDPAVVTMQLGQVNLVLLVCICLVWHALKQNGSAWAMAIPLAFAIVLKTYPGLLVLLLIACRRYKAAALTLGLFAGFCALSFAVLPSGIWTDWITRVLPNGDEAHPGPWNQNIRAFIARAFMPNQFSEPLIAAPGLVKPSIMLLSACVFAVTMWLSYRCWRIRDGARLMDLHISLYLFTIFLIAPVSWEHHFIYLLPCLVLILLMLLSGEARGHWRWIAPLSLCLIAWRLPIFGEGLKKGAWVLLISAKFYPAVALWLLFVARTWLITRHRILPEAAVTAVNTEASVALAHS